MLGESGLSDVESSLLKNFCNYLESEGIVSTYETKDLLSYSAGLKARKAIAGIFNQVASRLEMEDCGFKTTSIEDKKDHWPQLKIQHPKWKEIFGDGDNWKISIWFTVPGIWEAQDHGFILEIELWNEGHGNQWSQIKPKLPEWFKTLEARNFSCSADQTWNRHLENPPASQIQSEPKRIYFGRSGDGFVLDQNLPKKEDELVNLLVDRAKAYAEIVECLGTRK
jgi:hypothetical protein